MAGCIVQTSGTTSETATPSTPERIENSAKTPQEPTTPSSAEYDVEVSEIEDLVHEEMNQRRRDHGVSPLERSEKLDTIARYKSWDMAQRDYFAHQGLNGTSHQVLRDRYNSDCKNTGQNLHKANHQGMEKRIKDELDNSEKIARVAVNSLMNSTGHRKNILDPDYELQGIGIFVDENGTVFLTQEFCG
jgi:uncharacterized protein YkwD